MNNLLSELDKVDKIAKASKFKRMLSLPFKYTFAIGFNNLIYPRTKKGLLREANTFFGRKMKVVLPAGTDLLLTGGKSHDSEIRLAKFLILNIRTSDTFIDVGAHFGYFSLLASKLAGSEGKVFSFEASKETYKVFNANIEGVNNIKAFNKAISDKSEMIEFYEFPVLYSEYNTMNVSQFEDQNWIKKYKPQKVSIPAVTIDSVIEEYKVFPKMIKIDVEGAEFKVLSGAVNTLREKAPIIIMEFLEKSRHNAEHEKAAALLKEYGYKSNFISQDGTLIEIKDLNAYVESTRQESDNIVFSKQL